MNLHFHDIRTHSNESNYLTVQLKFSNFMIRPTKSQRFDPTKITTHMAVYSHSPWPVIAMEIAAAAYNYKYYPP